MLENEENLLENNLASSTPNSNEKEGEKNTEPSKVEESVDDKEKDKSSEVKPYKVFASDISIVEAEFIDYYKTRLKIMAMKYKLVGKFDREGKYIIDDDIKRDLVKMEKEIEENGEEYYKAIALYMKKHFYFHIKIAIQDDGMAKASLFLSEYVEDFLENEYIVSHIADFVDIFDDDYRIKLRKAFHLVDVEVKVDDTAVPNLAVVMQDAFDFELIVGGLYDMASQIYIMRMLKLLEENGELGKKVLARYRELLVDKDIEINEKFRYTRYKALLDRAIDEFGGLEKLGIEKGKLKEIVKDINNVIHAIDKASSKAGGIEGINTQNKGEKAEKKTKSPTNKPSKGSSTGNSSPSTPKKKDEKKKDDNKKVKGGVTLSPDEEQKTSNRQEKPKDKDDSSHEQEKPKDRDNLDLGNREQKPPRKDDRIKGRHRRNRQERDNDDRPKDREGEQDEFEIDNDNENDFSSFEEDADFVIEKPNAMEQVDEAPDFETRRSDSSDSEMEVEITDEDVLDF